MRFGILTERMGLIGASNYGEPDWSDEDRYATLVETWIDPKGETIPSLKDYQVEDTRYQAELLAKQHIDDAKAAQEEEEKVRAIALKDKAAGVVDRKTPMSLAELESSHKDLAELVHTMARKLGFE